MPCSKGMRKCKALCLHRDFVESYRMAYWNWEEEMDRVCIGYKTEEEEYRQRNPPPLFKDWLIHHRRDSHD